MPHFLRSIQTRRQFVLCSSAFTLSALVPLRTSAQRIRSEKPQEEDPQLAIIPRDTLLKFNPDGSPRPFAGNTVICHLPQQSRLRDAVAGLGDSLRSASFAAKLATLPSDSYHFTIFGGPNDQDRGRYGWPSGIPVSTSITECNRVIGERIARFRMHTELPIRFRLDQEKTLAPQRASGLQLVPVDANEKLKLSMLRDRMAAEVFRYRADDHETFGFHISLAYQMRGFAAEERREYQDVMTRHLPTIVGAAPVIELGIPEFCTFENMYRFDIHTLIRT
jgi:hypothetical protein